MVFFGARLSLTSERILLSDVVEGCGGWERGWKIPALAACRAAGLVALSELGCCDCYFLFLI